MESLGINFGNILTLIGLFIGLAIQYSALSSKISKLEGRYDSDIRNINSQIENLHNCNRQLTNEFTGLLKEIIEWKKNDMKK